MCSNGVVIFIKIYYPKRGKQGKGSIFHLTFSSKVLVNLPMLRKWANTEQVYRVIYGGCYHISLSPPPFFFGSSRWHRWSWSYLPIFLAGDNWLEEQERGRYRLSSKEAFQDGSNRLRDFSVFLVQMQRHLYFLRSLITILRVII